MLTKPKQGHGLFYDDKHSQELSSAGQKLLQQCKRPCQDNDPSFPSSFYMQQLGVQQDQDFQAPPWGWV